MWEALSSYILGTTVQLRPTTHHLCIYWATPTLTTCYHEQYANPQADAHIICHVPGNLLYALLMLCLNVRCQEAMEAHIIAIAMQQPAGEEHPKIHHSTKMHAGTHCGWLSSLRQDGWTSSRHGLCLREAHGLLTGHPTEMSSVSLYLSLMVRNLKRRGKTCATVPTMQQVPSPS